MEAAHKAPTLADLEALPPHIKGEIIEGVLYTMTRPRAPHQHVLFTLSASLRPLGSGSGGWWILPEPGIELPGTPEIAPDLAGWRKERLPTLPDDELIRLVPDWVCEISSPSSMSAW
jgi:Uma2 family endonuclease